MPLMGTERQDLLHRVNQDGSREGSCCQEVSVTVAFTHQGNEVLQVEREVLEGKQAASLLMNYPKGQDHQLDQMMDQTIVDHPRQHRQAIMTVQV